MPATLSLLIFKDTEEDWNITVANSGKLFTFKGTDYEAQQDAIQYLANAMQHGTEGLEYALPDVLDQLGEGAAQTVQTLFGTTNSITIQSLSAYTAPAEESLLDELADAGAALAEALPAVFE